jgi:threonine aldolase
LYALGNHVSRLKDDHKRAQTIGETLIHLSWVEKVLPVETNILIFQVRSPLMASEVIRTLADKGIQAFATDKQSIRFVTHLDFTDDMLDHSCSILKSLHF